MQFALVVMILMAVLAGQGEPAPVAATAITWLSFAGMLLLAPMTAACGSFWIIRGMQRDYPDCRSWLLRFERLQWFVVAAWLIASGLLLIVGRWPQIIRGSWQLQRWPLVDDLATIAPPLLALVLIWTIYWWAERSLPADHESTDGPWFKSWRHFVGLHARQQLGLPLVPVLLVLFAQDLTAYLVPKLAATTIDWSTAAAFPVLLLTLPWMLRWIWPTSALPAGELRQKLVAICQATRCSVREILVWHTGGRMPNAAIAGLIPAARYLLLSDAILTRLNSEQIAAVVKHECTHVRRQHFILRMMVVGLPVWWALCCRAEMPAWQEFSLALGEQWGLPRLWQELLVWPVAACGYALFTISWYSRWLEFDADLGVLSTAEAGAADPQERLALVAPFTGALCAITGDWTQRSWMHPSVVERVAFLRHCARDPNYAVRFRRRIDLFSMLLIACYLVPLVVFGWGWR